MNTALLVSITPEFLCAYEVFIKSFLKNNTWFKNDIVIIDLGLTDEIRDRCRLLYNKTVFKIPKWGNYKNIPLKHSHYFIRPNYFKIDAFSYSEYDQIVMLDVDMLVMGDISNLFNETYHFAAVRSYSPPSDRLNDNNFNGGVIVIGRKHLQGDTYSRLIEKLDNNDYVMCEQELFIKYFDGRTEFLPKSYNWEKRCIHSQNSDIPKFSEAKIIHYVGPKPWREDYQDGERFRDLITLWRKQAKFNKREPKQVIIIGNAPSVLQRKKGKVIDGADVVIRINNFEIKGFEKNVGTKTDHIMCTFATPHTECLESFDPGCVHMFAAEHYGDYEFLQNRVNQEHENPRFAGCKIDISKVDILSDYYYHGLMLKIGLLGKQRTTTGLIAIEWALNHYPFDEIYTYGIDFFPEAEKHGDEQYHYMKDHISYHNKYHDHAAERGYYSDLLLKGMVTRL